MTGKELIKFLQNNFTEEELEMGVVYNDTEWGYCSLSDTDYSVKECDEYVPTFGTENKSKKNVIVFY